MTVNISGNEVGCVTGALPQSGWQPIETADKNGDVLIFSTFDGVCTAYYDGEVDQWYKSGKSPHDFDFVASDAVFPTHWQPLPPAPASVHGGGGMMDQGNSGAHEQRAVTPASESVDTDWFTECGRAYTRLMVAEERIADLERALGECQRVLAMMVSPDRIIRTSSIEAWASAVAAEAGARAALAAARGEA